MPLDESISKFKGVNLTTLSEHIGSQIIDHHQLIKSYVNKNFSKIKSAVGCYNIEGPAKKFFENIDGSFYNIIGLDIIKFLRSLKSI